MTFTSPHKTLVFSTLLFLLTNAQTTSFRPKAIVLTVTKEPSTLQYTALAAQRTPPVPITLTLDLGGEFLWLDCHSGFTSSSLKPVSCRSALCSLSGSRTCTGDICTDTPFNPFLSTGTAGNVSTDVLHVPSTDGSNPGRIVSIPNLLFACAPSFLRRGLAAGAVGIAGLGRTRASLPSLLSAAFSLPRKFAVCLSSNSGALFFGDGPYVFFPGIDASKILTYTPLIRNPVSLVGGFDGESSAEYFIRVKSVKVDGKTLAINASLLSIDSEGFGGTKISTVEPYTLMETSIHRAVVDAFVAAMAEMNVARVSSVAPFGACFAGRNIGGSRTGAVVPPIELELQGGASWIFSGRNSMVYINEDVLCLAFVDGGGLRFSEDIGRFTPTAIVIGGHQIEDNLIQIDLAASRLGFSFSLLARQSSCSSFNFTSIG